MYSSQRLRIILILMIVLCGVFAYSYGSRLSERNELESAIAAQEEQIAVALDEKAALEADLALINTNEYLDRVARQELDLALPGDQVLVLVKPTFVAPHTSAQTAIEPSGARTLEPGSAPVWQQWVVFFTDEAGSAP